MSSGSDHLSGSYSPPSRSSSHTSLTGAVTTRLSALQTGLFAASVSQPGTWIGSHIFPLPPSIDLPRFKSAWSTVVQQNEILRSRIIWDGRELGVAGPGLEGMRLLVLDEEEIQWEERVMEGEDSLATVVGQLRARNMGFGQKLSAFTLLRIRDGPLYFIWTMHHALYDNSHLFVLDDVLQLYNSRTTPAARPSFTEAFIDRQITEVDYHEAASAFWTEQLAGCEDVAIFPPPPTRSASQPQTRVETPFPFPAPKRTIVADATNSTLIRAAWAAVVAKHTATSDVVFGCTVAGRYNERTKGTVGPTFATVPVRVRLDGNETKTLAQSLEELQVAAARAKDHEQVGLQFIQDLSRSARRAASFQNLLVVQPKNHPTPAPVTGGTPHVYSSCQSNGRLELTKTHLDLAQTYGLVMEVTPSSSDTWLLVAKYDDRLLSAWEVEWICRHFSRAICEVFRQENRDTQLRNISLLTDTDLEVIKGLASDSCVEDQVPNAKEPALLHREFERRAKAHPQSVAIDGWDLSLTYAELDTHSTNLARYIQHNHLTGGPGDSCRSSVIPICFSKSAYAVISMLAILKTGHAYLPVDPGWPDERVRAIMETLDSQNGEMLGPVLCDSEQEPRFEASLRKNPRARVLAVEHGLIQDIGSCPRHTKSENLPTIITPSDLAYVIFTSGSTGLPKGIAMSHRACTSNFHSRLSTLRSYTSTTRVLQFSSFAFDVSVFDIFGTLSAGGCIVIPHESHRVNPSELSRFMTERRVNWASLSPTLVKFLDPSDVPTLETLIVGGELLTRDIITRWKSLGPDRPAVRLGNELGPSETCVACVGNYDVAFETDARDLGRPVGGNKLFLVDQDDSSRLVPVGCVGELVVCGDSVMDGYLGDPTKTDQASVDIPQDLLPPTPGSTTHTKAFKTGDLFRWDEKGHLIFIGRKDRQLKLRGFRMEGEEIEGCVRLEDGVTGAVVEIMATHGGGGSEEAEANNDQELVCFITFRRPRGSASDEDDRPELSGSQAGIVSPSSDPQLHTLIQRIRSRIRDALPHYMTPRLYVPVSHIPMTRTGKQDRNQLKSLLSQAAPQILQEIHGLCHIEPGPAGEGDATETTAGEAPLSPIEHDLRHLWAKVLGALGTGDISRDSNFFHLGGNSIKAIQLSALAEKTGLGALDVLGIYESPTLQAMAALCSSQSESEDVTEGSWTDVGDHVPDGTGPLSTRESLASVSGNPKNDTGTRSKEQICATLGLGPEEVEDIYPCTPLQEGLFAVSLRQPGTYVAARVWRLGPEVDVAAFRDAWEVAVESNEILRTVIAEHDDAFWQVVLPARASGARRQTVQERKIRELDIPAENKDSVQRLLAGHDEVRGGTGRLSLFEILTSQCTEERYFKWTIHHAVYDACVLSMIWAQVRLNYQHLIATHRRPAGRHHAPGNFSRFVRSTYPPEMPPASRSFWEAYLSAPEPWETFPSVSRCTTSLPQTDTVTSRHFDLQIHTPPGVTEATLIRAAWAWVQSLYLGADDVVFGATLSGRSAPGARDAVGPTITTVPVRVSAPRGMRVGEYLARVQDEANAMMRHEHAGLSRVRALGGSAGWACGFSNILVVQDNSRGRPQEPAWEGVEAVGADTDIRHSTPLVLECVLGGGGGGGGLGVHAMSSSEILAPAAVELVLAHLGAAVRALSDAAAARRALGDIGFFSRADESWIRGRNHEAKPSADRLVHDVFGERARQCGDKVAVDAWDVRFTYGELDRASDVVARYLVQHRQVGAGPGVLIAVSFEKSGWAVLAMLSVWKAGCGFVPLDLGHPASKLADIVASTRARTVLCSAGRAGRLRGLVAGAVLALDRESLRGMEDAAAGATPLPQLVTPGDICYVLFTSGSTGRPKGVVLEHASVCTSLLGHADSMRVGPSSRVLQFAAYTFDTSIGEIFTALLVGATLCVPSEQQRMNSLAGFINEKAVDWLWLTPTVAGFLDPLEVPGVRSMVVGGEAASTRLFEAWIANGTSLVYGYGPTEASITITLDVNVTADTDPARIGKPICASVWVVDPLDDSRLLPVGCVGELVVSGPTVGRGYLDGLKTARAFGTIPEAWEALARPGGQPGRQRERFYKTGDLVRHDVTGDIVFVGRKDDQVKLHGQRIELSEITLHIDQVLGGRCSSIVEKMEISHADASGGTGGVQTLLVAFFMLTGPSHAATSADGRDGQDGKEAGLFCTSSPRTTRVINDLETRLSAVLPAHMVPSLFVPLRFVPITTTGKVDRNRLRRELSRALGVSGREGFMPEGDRIKQQPRDGAEEKLHEIWQPVLGLPAGRIGVSDSFLRLGGDSLKAIALVHAARRAGLHISVEDVFLHPVLSDMAKVLRGPEAGLGGAQDARGTWQEEEGLASLIPAFSMVKDGIDVGAVRAHASDQCRIAADDIEDIYPCTATQVGIVVASSMATRHERQDYSAGLYVLRRRVMFDTPSAAIRFAAAWDKVRKAKPILRTRIIEYQSQFYQVVVKGDAAPPSPPRGPAGGILGQPLAELETGLDSECEISLHHSIYDAVLLPRILEDIRQEYLGSNSPLQPSRMIPFRDFVQHLERCDDQAASSFWKHYLAPTDSRDKTAPWLFPSARQSPDIEQQQPSDTMTTTTKEITRHFTGNSIENKTHCGITLANIITAAWAIVTARHTGAEDVIFGNTLSGRDVILGPARAGSEDGLVEGPTLATVPLRFCIAGDKSVADLLHETQHDAVQVRRHQHLGMAKIAKTTGNSMFRTLLVVQTPVDTISSNDDDDNDDDVLAALQDLPGIRGLSEHQVAQQEYPLVLECLVTAAELRGVRAYYDGRAIEESLISVLLAHFEQAIRTLVLEDNQQHRLGDIDLVTETDLARLRKWNANPHEESRETLLDLFLDRARLHPQRDALYTTESTLSYEQLDRYSSNAAWHISERMGDSDQDTGAPLSIALCYEKSAWAVVSMLAIMKLGAAYVPLDPTSPDGRLAMMLDDVKASTIICSPGQATRFQDRAARCNIIVFDGQVHDRTLTERGGRPYRPKRPVSADSLAYILFTSGSTGRPKGVMVPHRAICTSILAFSPAVRLSQDSRVLQFSSFGFDASVGDIFATLGRGGCICMPGEGERLGGVCKFMNDSRANWAFLTPATLRAIAPGEVPLLRTLVVGGEPLPPSLFRTWAARPGRPELMEAYGPTECCVFSTLNTRVTPRTHPQDIGVPLGGATWVVDPRDHHRLTPVGCVGELVISGPTLAAGYLQGRPPAGAGATSGFVEQPPRWAASFPGHAVARLYRTGDLVRFKADGGLRYVARKDNQVSLRGIRMELGEIDYHLARSAAGGREAPVVVMTGEAGGEGGPGTGKPLLACFFVVDDDVDGGSTAPPGPLRMTEQRKQTVRSTVSYLESRVPRYMVPSVFLPLRCFPANSSGKVDRRALVRDILAHYTAPGTEDASDATPTRPMTADETTLQDVWSQLLGVDAEAIRCGDSFLRLGGDSVDMIRMVTMLRQKGLHLNPAEAMADPRLSSVASKMTPVAEKAVALDIARTTPFSLVRRRLGTQGAEALVKRAAEQCAVPQGGVEDVYPCTPLQEGLLSVSERIPGSYLYRQAWTLSVGVDLDRLVAAYRGLCKAHPILRTRFITGDDAKTYQVVLLDDTNFSFHGADGGAAALPTSIAEARKVSGPLSGKPLHSVEIHAADSASGSRGAATFVRTMHHALYDAWSLAHLDTELAQRYFHTAAGSFIPPRVPSYARFIEHITASDAAPADGFWRQYLAGARRACWPSVPQGHQPQTTACVQRTFELDQGRACASHVQDHTKASVALLAWAILVGKYSNQADVSFGTTLSGRDAPIEGIEAMVGPTNTTVPVRYQLLASGDGRPPTVSDALGSSQRHMSEMSAFQHHGLQDIMRLSPEARQACNFSSLLVVQPARQLRQRAESTGRVFQDAGPAGTPALLHPYPLVVEVCFQDRGSSVGVWIHYDAHLFSGPQVEAVARQLHMALEGLIYSDPSTTIATLELNDQISLGLMRRFHDEACQDHAERDIPSLIQDQRTRSPDAPAISAWDGEMTYAELDTMSSSLSLYLRETLGLRPGSLVATCFEKSVWAIVAKLAVIKAGGAYVPIDPAAPDSYKRLLLGQLAAQGPGDLVLVSEGQSEPVHRAGPLTAQTVVITGPMVAGLPRPSSPAAAEVVALQGLAAYVLFTSGSTGVPKGVVVEHRSACASILAHGAACGFGPSTRALQFAAFTFDASVMEIWTTLAFGGCVCVPSESQRVDDLERYMEGARVNWAFLTPTVGGLVRKERVGSLRTLVLGGEALGAGCVQKWAATARGPRGRGKTGDPPSSLRLMNGYGPTECCVFTCVNTSVTRDTDPADVGRAVGASAWVVDPGDYNRLMPLGCPGELLIVGPTLARGYLADPARTSQAFVFPQWSGPLLGRQERCRAYRTGDLASHGADGHVRILGRLDNQIKLHGMRIDPGEVESALLACAGAMGRQVDEVVVDKLLAGGGEAEMVAFVRLAGSPGATSPPAGTAASFARDLSSCMALRVPAHMVPSRIVAVAKFPTTTAGKVDRRALLATLVQDGHGSASSSTTSHRTPPLRRDGTAGASSPGVQDNGEVGPGGPEGILRSLWAEVLRIDDAALIGRQDDFFALGGESIRAIRLVAMARERHRLRLTVNEIFRHPVLADMAGRMGVIEEEPVDDQPFDMLMDED